MALIVVTSANPGDGKTGVAAAIARHYAYAGTSVRLARIAGGGSPNAPRDAALFAGMDFAPGSSSATISPEAVTNPPAGELLVVEADLADLEQLPPAQVVFVTRSTDGAAPEGITPVATVVIGAPATEQAADAQPARVLLPDDRTLAGFTFDDARDLLRAEVLVEGDGDEGSCDYLVVAPFGSDAGQPYFRRFPSKAVVGRFDRTDMHLAAIRGDAEFLILTGGRYPSDYVYDAARATGTPVLLSGTDTENTVITLEAIWDNTRFSGERKLDRMADLLEPTGLYEALEV